MKTEFNYAENASPRSGNKKVIPVVSGAIFIVAVALVFWLKVNG